MNRPRRGRAGRLDSLRASSMTSSPTALGQRTFLAATLTLLVACTTASSQVIREADSLVPPVALEGGTFGNRISVEGDWLAVGADHDAGVLAPGRVLLYQRTGSEWTFRQQLMAPDGFGGDHFGLPVVLRDDRLLVGMPWDDESGNRSGSVHAFALRDGLWEWQQKIATPAVENTGATFGASLCFGRDIDEIVVGAYLESLENQNEGAVWVFRDQGSGYQLDQRLALPGDQVAAYFGRAVDVENGVLAVGVPGFIGPDGFRHGAVAIHTIDGDEWSLDGLVVPTAPVQYQSFGEFLDLEADRLAVGSPFEDTYGPDHGAVHLYRMVDGIPVPEFTAVPPAASRGFGFPTVFSPDGDKLYTGAYATSSDEGSYAGAAWVFQRIDGEWGSPVRLEPASNTGSDFFGLSAALDGERIFVGIPRHDGPASDSGMVAVFELDDCDASGVLDAWEIAAGSQLDTDGNGVPDQCQIPSGDLNGDGVVDGQDLGLFTAYWGTDGSSGGDLNGDGLVDGGDIALILTQWSA